ncbi:MAG: accessory Sec system protein Asp1 [Lachnospiraceae bacterium]|nr:accessory Sec system protein Asp1 [Lachnospiraceae bacterium]
MLHFIPAWYQQNNWCENEQYWYARRMRTEFDDTVKHIQLFHRSKAYEFQIMLLSFAPNFRHFLHRQSVFHAPYWSCFDAIQEVRRKKVMMLSFHNLNWPEHIEFVYSPFALIALLHGEKYAQVEFGEDGNPIQVDIYQHEKLQRRNIYDDRGFVSSTIVYEDEKPVYQDYLTDKGVWKIRVFLSDGHVEVNPKCPTYLLEHAGVERINNFTQSSYQCLEQLIYEVLAAYLELTDKNDMFCIAMHELHTEVLKQALKDKKKILSFFECRYDLEMHPEDMGLLKAADFIITDFRDNLKKVQGKLGDGTVNITDITPFDSRVDFGISQQLNVQKIMVPVDGMEEARFGELIRHLGEYLLTNDNARIHLFTRVADVDRKRVLLERTRMYLKAAGLEPGWAEEEKKSFAENLLDGDDAVPVKFYVEQCVDELSVSKCIREQRLMVDMRKNTELYLRITGISVGIPQIVYRTTEFVEDGKNGLILKEMDKVSGAIAYYLDSLTNWNEAMVYSYELGKKYTTGVLKDKWKEVIDFVGCDSGSTAGK